MTSFASSRDHALQKFVTTASASADIYSVLLVRFVSREPPPAGPSFVVQVKTVLVLVIAEKLGEASPIYDRLEHFLGRLVGQQHREMLQNDLLLERAIFLSAQKAHQVRKKSMLLELLAHHQLALVHVAFEKFLAERFEHDIAGRRRHEAQDLGRLHHLEQVAELELQVARDFVAVVAPTAVLESFEQPEDPRQLAIRDRIDTGRHQARSSISENTLSVSALNESLRRSRGRGMSTFKSPTMRPGDADSTRILSASSTASSIMCVTIRIVCTGMSGACHMSSSSSRSVIAVRASSAENGSSIRSSFGSTASARAKPTRCFIPPDSSRG